MTTKVSIAFSTLSVSLRLNDAIWLKLMTPRSSGMAMRQGVSIETAPVIYD